MPARKKTAETDTVVSYIRVSTDEQAESGLGLDAQRAKIADECNRRGWRHLAEFAEPGVSGGVRVEDRPNLVAALNMIESGGAAALMVAKLDRLSRSASDAAGLLERAQRQGWSLVACDLGVDTSTPAGEMMANVMGTFARFEKRLIGQRTSEALQAKKRQGVQLGTPLRTPLDIITAIVEMRRSGATLAAVANQMNEQGVPTVQGGRKWYPSTIAAVLQRAEDLVDRHPELAPAYAYRGTPACWTWPVPQEIAQEDPWGAVVAWQGGRCAICGSVSRFPLENDHDHRTGTRRGQLCKTCNRHEGKCWDSSCACSAYRERPPTTVLGVRVEHGGWEPVTVEDETPEEAAARVARIRSRQPLIS